MKGADDKKTYLEKARAAEEIAAKSNNSEEKARWEDVAKEYKALAEYIDRGKL